MHGEKLPLEEMVEGLISQMPQTCDAYFSVEVKKMYKGEKSRQLPNKTVIG